VVANRRRQATLLDDVPLVLEQYAAALLGTRGHRHGADSPQVRDERRESTLAGEVGVRPPPPNNEALQDRFVDVLDDNALALQPANEVLDEPQLVCE
jgi:hypothetical protein